MFILSQSLQWRIGIFIYGFMLIVLPGSFDYLERSLAALSTVAAFFLLLRPMDFAGYQPDGWLMWLDIALSWLLLWSYIIGFGVITISGGHWVAYVIALALFLAAAGATIFWYGLREIVADDVHSTYA